MPSQFRRLPDSGQIDLPQPIRELNITLDELSTSSAQETIAAARVLLLEYGRFVASQPGVASFCLGDLEREAWSLPQSYLAQNGGAILASIADLPVGFVAWRTLPAVELAAAWEMKRLWVRPQARGSGLGRALAQAVIERARKAGKSTMLLDTAPDAMPAALRLYRDMGFVECPPYSGSALSGIAYLRKSL